MPEEASSSRPKREPREVSDERWAPIWKDLTAAQGWTFEQDPAGEYYIPLGVDRLHTKSHVDYFESKNQVLAHIEAPGYVRTKPVPHGNTKSRAAPAAAAPVGRPKRGAAKAAEAAFKVQAGKPALYQPEEPAAKRQVADAGKDTWLASLESGSKCDAHDAGGSVDWYSAKVMEVEGTMVKIHFQGFHTRYDEWMERDPMRLQPLGTMTGASPDAPPVVGRPKAKRARTAAAEAGLSLQPAAMGSSPREWGGGETPELYAESTQLMMGKYRLKIGLMDPPRVVIRDMVAMVCELTDKESAALNIKSLARNIQYEKLSKSKDASSTVVISLENLHELLHICATFRAAAYKPKVLNLLKQDNPTLPRLFAMARVVALSVVRKQPFPPPAKGDHLVGLPVLANYNTGTAQESWYFGDVQRQTAQNYTLRFYADDTT